MFNQDFYPTPDSVADMMGIEAHGKTIYEPSAGSGNLLRYLRRAGAKRLLASEKDERLANIAKAECDEFIGLDFLSVVPEQVSHIDMIVMNPPFSQAEKHINHAWEIAPEGCEIISLCNWASLENSNRFYYHYTNNLIENYGICDNLGPVFSQGAERTTGVEIGLVRLHKPMTNRENDNFWGFYMEEEGETSGGSDLVPNDEVRRLVGLHRASLERFAKLEKAAKSLHEVSQTFGFNQASVSVYRNEEIHDMESFSRTVTVQSWKKIFSLLKLERFVTTGVMKDIEAFARRQEKVPFTVKNVYRMLEIIVGTSGETMNRAIVEAVDNFTNYTHKNRYGLPGWKTNLGHLLNKKFIVDRIVEKKYGKGFDIAWSGGLGYRDDKVNDLMKAICHITGTSYDSVGSFGSMFRKQDRIQSATWYDWGHLEFKVFHKGTAHFKFKDLKVWEELNRRYAEAKGQVLPEQI